MLKDTGLVKGCVAQWFGSQRHGQKALILKGDDSATRERLEGKLASKEMEKKLVSIQNFIVCGTQSQY